MQSLPGYLAIVKLFQVEAATDEQVPPPESCSERWRFPVCSQLEPVMCSGLGGVGLLERGSGCGWCCLEFVLGGAEHAQDRMPPLTVVEDFQVIEDRIGQLLER